MWTWEISTTSTSRSDLEVDGVVPPQVGERGPSAPDR